MRRLPALFVLCAWLLASGAHWDLVQGFAWGRMIANYSRTMPLAEALRLTFTPENLCGVCELVAASKTRADSGADVDAPVQAGGDTSAKAKEKLLLALAPEAVLVRPARTAVAWPTERSSFADRARPAPPVEPPRAA